MYDHTTSVYNNSCLKVPRDAKLNHPVPLYEKEFDLHLDNTMRKLSLDSDNSATKKRYVDKQTTKSFIDFISNIPEYNEINHLSNKEFYKKLENLKEKRRYYEECLRNEIKFDCKDSEWIEEYKNLKLGAKNAKNGKKGTIKSFCTSPLLNANPDTAKVLQSLDVEVFSDKEIATKPPSRRSVRIETPSDKLSTNLTPEPFRSKSRANFPSASPKIRNNTEWDDLSLENLKLDLEESTPLPVETKSAPCSPVRQKPAALWDNNEGITIPKPFQMTVRDEEMKIVDELYDKMKKPKEKSEMFKAHDVPIQSQIPLFDKIMADQERRSYLTKQRRKAELQSQMKPFSFTKRDEEIQELTRELSRSTPNLYYEPPLKIKKFKAKPVPKNLFSNYIYKKMHEDEFYRALQKKIRAEEMLRAASLPPSMAKREKTKPRMDVCPRSYRDTPKEEKHSRKAGRVPDFKAYHDQLEKELEELKNEFISTSPRPFKFKTTKRNDKRGKRCYRHSSASSKSSSTKTPSSSSLDVASLNRSNLAAVLRIQSARRKLEMDMVRRLEEARLKEEARWKEKLMRKKPVWQALAYSHEEDLAMRLQLRREEERLRNEEYRNRMQLMLGRVNRQPTLFERQSQIRYPKTKEELVEQLYKDYRLAEKSRKKRLTASEMRSLVEMKDEAIQAFLEENNKYGMDGAKENESFEEGKEKCECSSD
nr:unnamed protein product [Callosobruchus chinensis]